MNVIYQLLTAMQIAITYSTPWACLVAQTVKNLPAMQKAWV